jgi:hypothetical protein
LQPEEVEEGSPKYVRGGGGTSHISTLESLDVGGGSNAPIFTRKENSRKLFIEINNYFIAFIPLHIFIV